jgi:outer membrane protein assembly factor BamB
MGATMKGLRALVVLLAVAPAAMAADWPQWLGPNRDGSTTEKVAAWKEPLVVLWRQPVGEGHSSPVVAGGKVYLHTRIKDKTEEQLSAFDAATGKPLWQQPYERGKFTSLFGNGPRGTPAVVDGKVYTFGITGILTCFDAAKGEQLWQVDTLKKYKASNLFFGASCSPLVEGDLVLVDVGAKGASIVAFDRKSGDEKWKALDEPASYSSPIARGKGKDRQVVFLTGKRLIGLSPLDGKRFWDYPLVDKLMESSTTPAVAGDVLFGSSITAGGVGLRLTDGASGPQAVKLWEEPKYNCYFSTPVAVGDHFYVVTGTKPPALVTKATLRCVEAATGRELWARDKVGKYHASLTRTGDNKLLMLEEEGDLVLLQPDPEGYRELARSHVCGTTWAHPAIADGRLYVRDGAELVCVELPK